jgi:hypothetical protein
MIAAHGCTHSNAFQLLLSMFLHCAVRCNIDEPDALFALLLWLT